MKAVTGLFGTDSHHTWPGAREGGVDPAAWSCFTQSIDIVKPKVFGHLGDLLEMDSVSPWAWKRRKKPPLEFILPNLDAEYAVGNEVLDDLDRRLDRVGCSERFFNSANHEKWGYNLTEEYPMLANKYDPHIALRFKQRGWNFVPDDKFYKVGKLNFHHTAYTSGDNHARKAATTLGSSIMYGHLHNQQTAHVQRLEDGTVGAWGLGCLCLLDKKFLAGRPSNWNHSFAIVHFNTDGTFVVEIVEIYRGRCFVYGKELNAK